jgi:hypothetical protein
MIATWFSLAGKEHRGFLRDFLMTCDLSSIKIITYVKLRSDIMRSLVVRRAYNILFFTVYYRFNTLSLCRVDFCVCNIKLMDFGVGCS